MSLIGKIDEHFHVGNDSRTVAALSGYILEDFAENQKLFGWDYEFVPKGHVLSTEYNTVPEFKNAVDTLSEYILKLFPPKKMQEPVPTPEHE